MRLGDSAQLWPKPSAPHICKGHLSFACISEGSGMCRRSRAQRHGASGLLMCGTPTGGTGSGDLEISSFPSHAVTAREHPIPSLPREMYGCSTGNAFTARTWEVEVLFTLYACFTGHAVREWVWLTFIVFKIISRSVVWHFRLKSPRGRAHLRTRSEWCEVRTQILCHCHQAGHQTIILSFSVHPQNEIQTSLSFS